MTIDDCLTKYCYEETRSKVLFSPLYAIERNFFLCLIEQQLRMQ